MRTFPFPAVFFLAPLFAFGLACGGDEGEDSRPPSPSPTETCEELRLARSEARPLELVQVEGVPAHFGELLAARVRSQTGAETFTLVARQPDSEEVLLHAPVHPEALLEGGEVSLQLVDGDDNACAPLPFRILPLAPAPETTERVRERIAAHLEGIAAFFGATVEELRATRMKDVPEHLLPLYLAQESLGGPENPNSLQALLAGTAPALEGEALPLPLVDALLAEMGLVEALDESLTRLAKIPSPEGPEFFPLLAHGKHPLQMRAGPQNAWQLHAEMEMAQWGDAMSGDGPLADGVKKGSGAVGLLGLVPHAGTKAGAMAIGSALFAFTKGAEAAAHLLPSRFVSLDFELRPERVYEDDDSTGKWREVMVVAASKGWELDRTILESLLQFTQVKGGYDAWLTRFGPPEGFKEALGSHLYTESVNWVIGEAAEGSGVFSIPPRQTEPIDITEDPWSFATVSFALSQEGRQGYRLNTSWEGEPRGEVQVGTTLGMYGGNHIYAKKDVLIEPLRVVIDPATVAAEPGEIIEFRVTVHGADKSISVRAEKGATTHQQQADGTHLITYEAPREEEGLPDTLTVTSESKGGLLANPQRPRPQALAIIRSTRPSIRIEPRGVCVETGSKQTFTATVENLERDEVRWEVDYGSITQSGVYTAPGEAGAAIVTATSVSDPSVSDSVSVGVGSCNCVWSVQVGGRGNARYMGNDLSISIEEGRVAALIFASPFDPALGASGLSAELEHGPAPGGPAFSSAEVQGSHFERGLNHGADLFESAAPLPIEFSKIEQSGDRFEVEGRISGVVYWQRVRDEGPAEEGEEWPGFLNATFRGSMESLPIPGGGQTPGDTILWCNPF